MVHVPYRGGGPLMNDALAGHIDIAIASAALMTPQIRSGKVRGMAQTGRTRIPGLPDVPTAIESGFAGFESYAWWGIFTPAPTPKPIIERFRVALSETLREETVSKNIAENMQITMLLGGPEEMRTFLSEQMKLWGPVVREHNIKGD
jgi:tripartite-type tricarboxylate transporter receptor subunit TctC